MIDILFFDCETTGLPPKGAKYDTDFNEFPHIVQLSWSMNGVLNDYIIRPDGYVIPGESTKIHGITQEMAEEKGKSLKRILGMFCLEVLVADRIVGHNIYFDTSMIKANARRHNFLVDEIDVALDKDLRICTMMKTIKFVGAKKEDSNRIKFPTLVELYEKLFNDTFPAHNAKEDVIATEKCFYELVKLGIIEI